jgi:hypothetical protein
MESEVGSPRSIVARKVFVTPEDIAKSNLKYNKIKNKTLISDPSCVNKDAFLGIKLQLISNFNSSKKESRKSI